MITGGGRQQCRFQLLRYVPDAVRNEFVHIGAVLRTMDSGEQVQTEIRFTRDWRRVRCLDPDADTELLEGMESELRGRLLEDPNGEFLRFLNESLSLNVQMTEPKGYLAESLPAGMDEIMHIYVDAPKRARVERLRGRAAIHTKMRGEFEQAGVWELMRKRIAASAYTRPGDPLRIDAGYRPNGLIRLFQAVSLEPGVETAKVLAFSAASLHEGVERVEKASLELTAIIEPAAELGATDDEPDRLELYRFGVETMEGHAIRVLTTSDLSRVAETARLELRV